MDKDKIVFMLSQGMSAYRIAKILPYSKPTILRFIKNNQLMNLNPSKVDYSNLLKDREKEVVDLYNDGLTCDEVAERTGHSPSQISVLLKNSGEELREWKYHVDESFFDTVDSEAKAYVLGWFYSDGCVNEQGKLRIQIQREDEAILLQIKSLIDYEGPLLYIPRPKRFPNRKEQVALCINRKSLADKLIAFGCLPNKSLIITYPEWINPKLEHHFLRGVFDGDGSVSVKKGKYLSASITTTDRFNAVLKQKLLGMGIDSGLYYREAGKNTCSLHIGQTAHAERFLDYLYADSTLYLERKRLIWQNHVSGRLCV